MEDILVQHTLGEHEKEAKNQTTPGKCEIGEAEMKEAHNGHEFG